MVDAFFSPDSSASVLARLVASANATIDVLTPSSSSWNGCSTPRRRGCSGCEPTYVLHEERFVLFRELLNACRYRGVRVRVLTNAFDDEKTCAGAVSPLGFLAMSAEVAMFRTTTFQHAKVIVVDGERTAISSVNWSKGSFLANREAGVVLTSTEAAAFVTSVFEYDWKIAEPWATPTDGIDEKDIRMMRNATRLEPFPLPSSNRSHYVPKRASYVANVAVATSPDAGATVVREALLSTRHSLRIYTYQITDVDIADVILDLIRERDVRVSMVLSRAIFMDSDRTASTKVVEYMRENARGNGTMSLRSSPHFFRYAHLKVLIVDDERVVVATGNLSPSDLPFPIPRSFEPASDSGRPVNRDFEVVIDDRRAANAFRLLFEGDSRDSTAYKPPTKF